MNFLVQSCGLRSWEEPGAMACDVVVVAEGFHSVLALRILITVDQQ